jgi:hypothetical protein
MTCKNFIDKQIIGACKKLVHEGFEYFAFILIIQGIELLGNLYDNESMSSYGESGDRFKKGLELFTHSFYKNQKEWVYKNLRGSLIHQIRPNSKIFLTTLKNGVDKNLHLKEYDNRKVFIIDELIGDFEKAFKKVLVQSEKRGYNVNNSKLNGEFLSIESISNSEDYPVNLSGGTENP